MKGYVRLKDPDEEVFLGDGAGCVALPSTEANQFRVWDKSGLTMIVPGERIVTIRLGTGRRPEGYAPLAAPESDGSE